MPRPLIAAGMVMLGAALATVNLMTTTPDGVAVTVETVRARTLTATASADARIRPRDEVDVSANVMGRVTRLAVVEGQRVEAGDLLIEIDPETLEGDRQRAEAAVAAARSALETARTQVEQARVNLRQARQALARQEQLGAGVLTTAEALEAARTEAAVRETLLAAAEQALEGRQAEIRQREAGLETLAYNLRQLTLTAPIAGLVTRVNVEEGENVVVGTMNNAGTVLLTIADLSAVEAEANFEETALPSLRVGQPAVVRLDAAPGEAFPGRVHEIGSSPTQASGGLQATRFRVVVAFDDVPPGVRPGFSGLVEVTTGTRTGVLAVPIAALTMQNVLFDEDGELVREVPRPGVQREPPDGALPPGMTREATRGLFVLADDRAVFTPVTIGIADERYVEVRTGVEADDRVITGPFATARRLADGDPVYVADP